jgi:hypothetical protein
MTVKLAGHVTHEGNNKCNPKRKSPLVKHRPSWEDNIKMDLKEKG